MSIVRRPCAGGFYPGDTVQQLNEFLSGFKIPDQPGKVVAGIVPHAGWFYSGAVAAKVIQTMAKLASARTLIIFGAVHTWGVHGNALFSQGAWKTPLGNVDIDEDLAKKVLQAFPELVTPDEDAHSDEHSIEVQLPMVKNFMPEVKILPIAAPPGPRSAELGRELGTWIAREKMPVAFLGSTDLTHYGPQYGFAPKGTGSAAQQWMKQNDERIITLALNFESDAIVKEASTHHNACGSGAMAATVAAAKATGATISKLLEYTTSYDVSPDRSFVMAVGYAGIVFGSPA